MARCGGSGPLWARRTGRRWRGGTPSRVASCASAAEATAPTTHSSQKGGRAWVNTRMERETWRVRCVVVTLVRGSRRGAAGTSSVVATIRILTARRCPWWRCHDGARVSASCADCMRCWCVVPLHSPSISDVYLRAAQSKCGRRKMRRRRDGRADARRRSGGRRASSGRRRELDASDACVASARAHARVRVCVHACCACARASGVRVRVRVCACACECAHSKTGT